MATSHDMKSQRQPVFAAEDFDRCDPENQLMARLTSCAVSNKVTRYRVAVHLGAAHIKCLCLKRGFVMERKVYLALLQTQLFTWILLIPPFTHQKVKVPQITTETAFKVWLVDWSIFLFTFLVDTHSASTCKHLGIDRGEQDRITGLVLSTPLNKYTAFHM